MMRSSADLLFDAIVNALADLHILATLPYLKNGSLSQNIYGKFIKMQHEKLNEHLVFFSNSGYSILLVSVPVLKNL